MAKIRIKGDTSGYIDLSAPAEAGTQTLTLPTSGSLLSSEDVLDSDQIGTGSVSANKIASGAVESAMTTQFGRRNLIINGAMQVAQRGTSSTASGFGSVDRFFADHGGISKTQSQESLTSSDDPYALGFRNYYRLENTSVSSSTAAYVRYFYRCEAQDIANSGWNYASSSSAVTLSFWVRSSLAGTYYCNLRSNDGTTQNYTISFTLASNTWTKVTKTIYGDSNITVNNDNGNGLELQIWPYLGTNYTTSGHTLDQWATYSGTDQTPDFSQNWANTSGATFDLTGVQLEVGTVATPFEHRSYGEELRNCQRYGFRFTGTVGSIVKRNASNYAYCHLHAPQPLRAVPSISVTSAGNMVTYDAAIDQSLTGFSVSTGDTDPDAAMIQYFCVADGVTTGAVVAHQAMDMFFDAEL